MPRPKIKQHKIAISITLDESVLETLKEIQEKQEIESISKLINDILKTEILDHQRFVNK